MKEKVSIIIPTYNRARSIKKSINSCLNQTYKNIEVIVVDDCSTDNTKKIIESINDNRLKYYKLRTNKGACYARNYGIKKATGFFITFNDSDDILYPNKIEKQYQNLLENDSDMDVCRIRLVSLNNEYSYYPSDNRVKNIKENYLDELVKGNYCCTAAIFVKKNIIINCLFDENMPRLQDYDLALRLLPNTNFSFNEEIYYDRLLSKDSISIDNNRLIQAVKNIVLKDYDINNNQKEILHSQLFDVLQELYDNINRERELYKSENNLLKGQLIEKDKVILKTINDKEKYKTAFENVINSKRYKLISAFLRK